MGAPFSGSFPHPDGHSKLIIENGRACVVQEGTVTEVLADDIEGAWRSGDLLVLSNGLWLEGLGPNGLRWRSRRVSWDGIRAVEFQDRFIVGESFSSLEESWAPFRVDRRNGQAEGGAYEEPCG